jgi:general secretion pathway protein B
MSFILDALKKSETDRQRQNGPALFEVRVAPPRNGLPLWAMGLAALLAVNLLIVGWVLLRRPAAAEAATGAPPAPGQTASGGSSGSYPGGTPGQAPSGYSGGGQAPAGYAGAGQAPGNQPYPSAGPGSNQPYPGAAPGSGQPYPGAPSGSAQAYQGQGAGPGLGAPAGPQGAQLGQGGAQGPGTVPVAGTAPTSPVAQTAGMTQPPLTFTGNGAGGQADGSTGQLNPDDYAPATDAPAPAGFGNHVSRGTSSGVPLYQDAALAPGAHIPQLRLDLHVFAAKPQERFVMINMQKLHEGDNLREGVHVESITPEGVVLSSNGNRFLLPHD